LPTLITFLHDGDFAMLNGTYYSPTTFYFGKGVELKVGVEVKKYADNVLLHYGQDSLKNSVLYDKVKKSLVAEGLKIYELGGVKPNPRADLVYQGIELCRKEGIDFILAVGGGSVIDSAKAISIGVAYGGDFYDFFERKAIPQEALNVGVILTIPGSGSESSPGTVITDLATKRKMVCDNPLLIPVFSMLNPECTVTIPSFYTSCGIVDALSHIFERYFSNTSFVDCSDRICEGLILTLMKYAILVQEEPDSYDIRAEIMWACKLAHDNTPGFGRKQDWACHKIGHEISGIYDAPHGVVMGVVFLAWMQWAYKKNMGKFIQFSERVFAITDNDNPEKSVEQSIEMFRRFLENLEMPTSLREIGLKDRSHFIEIANNSVQYMQSGTVGNFVRLAPQDIVEVLDLAY